MIAFCDILPCCVVVYYNESIRPSILEGYQPHTRLRENLKFRTVMNLPFEKLRVIFELAERLQAFQEGPKHD
jgi:hypothetical protein